MGAGNLSYKDVILQVCKRGNKWAEEVQVRLSGSLSDLHASEARYHLACRDKFMLSKNILAASRRNETSEIDSTLKTF